MWDKCDSEESEECVCLVEFIGHHRLNLNFSKRWESFQSYTKKKREECEQIKEE